MSANTPSESDILKLHSLIADEFQDAQRSVATHRKIVASLANIQYQAAQHGMELEFNKAYARYMNLVLTVKKSEPIGDRLVTLCRTFCEYTKRQCKFYLINEILDFIQ